MLVVNECPVCNLPSKIKVPAVDFAKYEAGALIQDAFPYLAPDEREIIQTGIHPSCWKAMFKDCERDN